ncbi:MFS transporter [Streptomyces sp. NA02950]|nr:MFS transporter [Streptomyces sp. NA02950]
MLCGLPRFAVAALVPGVPPLAVTMAVSGIAAGMLNPILTTVTYGAVPDELRSRVLGALTAGVWVVIPLGGLAAGYLVDGAGLTAAFLVTGGAYFLVTLSPLVFPVWRGMDREPVPPAAPAATALSSAGSSRPSAAPAEPTPRP